MSKFIVPPKLAKQLGITTVKVDLDIEQFGDDEQQDIIKIKKLLKLKNCIYCGKFLDKVYAYFNDKPICNTKHSPVVSNQSSCLMEISGGMFDRFELGIVCKAWKAYD